MNRLLSALPFATLALFAGCGETLDEPAAQDRHGDVARIRVTTNGNRGTRMAPLPYSNEAVPLRVGIEVFGRDNRLVTGFDRYVKLSVTPGVLVSVSGPDVVGPYIRLRGGVVADAQVTIARGYGEARLWVEDTGYAPVDPRRTPPPACANGRDDDGDGSVDYPGDLGCEASNDDDEVAGSYAAGTSEPIYFNNPVISDVQGRGSASPLLNERVTIVGHTRPEAPPAGSVAHRLVVIQTDNQGFFVTDIDDRSCTDAMGNPRACFNHLYSFNFRSPDGMRPCDLLATLTGSVAEFVSTTQLAQPGFQVGLAWRPDDPAAGRCLIPDPPSLTANMVASETEMESYESGLVRVENVRLPTVIGPGLAPNGVPGAGATNCDLNRDGSVDFDNAAESNCSNACDRNVECSEWNSWQRYGQVKATLSDRDSSGGVRRVAVAPRIVDPNFDPMRSGGRAATVTGTLRQVGPNWIVQPRCDQDLVIEGGTNTVRPARDTCLHERSIGEE